MTTHRSPRHHLHFAWRGPGPGRLAAGLVLALLLTQQSAMASETPINLGSDSGFAILAGTSVSVTGGGTITGNIGISPGTAFVPGTPPVTVNGTIYASGPIASQAQADLTIAYNDAAGRTIPAVVSGNIGGLTLVPGLYKSTSTLAVSSGDLTLDAQGDPNGVFIFQIASSFTMTSGRKVILAGGARAANIFWQVGSSATIGTTAVLHGTIMAAVSISILTGATLDGRALARSGAVSLNTGGGSSVTAPVAPIGPTVTATAPMNHATGVAINGKLAVTFSVAMDASSINPGSWTVMNGTTPVAGTISTSATIASFAPTAALVANTTYSANVTTAVKDQSGNHLANAYTWMFTTGATPDTTPPTVVSTIPANASATVAVNQKIAANFSETMDAATITTATMTVKHGTTAISGSVSYAGTTATFAPATALTANTAYTATITTGAMDLAGNAMVSAYAWTFTTNAAADTTPPKIVSINPAKGSVTAALNQKITAMFSETMDAATITTTTMTLQQGTTAILGTVSYAGTTATFAPNAALTANTVYTASITTGAKDLAGNAMANAFGWSFTTNATADTTAPTVQSTIPANGSATVAVNQKIAAIFSKTMDATTITTSTMTVQQGTTAVPGTVTYAGTTATFVPAAALAANTAYTATITTGAEDLAGNAVASDYVWTFTTSATADTTAPTVTTVTPANGATGIAATASIAVIFSEAMDQTTISTTSILLQQGGTTIDGTVTGNGSAAVFSPLVPLSTGTAYTVTITTDPTDLAGNALATAYTGTFTTAGTPPDTIPPTVTATSPVNGATLVPVTTTITANFSEAMDPTTISTATFTVYQGTTVIPGTVTLAPATAIFVPNAPLAYATLYTVTITTGAQDLSGNPLAAPVAWGFATAAGPSGDDDKKCGVGAWFSMLTMGFVGAFLVRRRNRR